MYEYKFIEVKYIYANMFHLYTWYIYTAVQWQTIFYHIKSAFFISDSILLWYIPAYAILCLYTFYILVYAFLYYNYILSLYFCHTICYFLQHGICIPDSIILQIMFPRLRMLFHKLSKHPPGISQPNSNVTDT